MQPLTLSSFNRPNSHSARPFASSASQAAHREIFLPLPESNKGKKFVECFTPRIIFCPAFLQIMSLFYLWSLYLSMC